MSMIFTNHAEGGSNGAAVTPNNSGGLSGSAWSLIYTPTGTSVTYSNARARGTMAYKYEVTTTPTQTMTEWDYLPPASKFYLRFYVFLPSLPSASIRLCELGTDSATAFGLGLRTDGQFIARDSAGAEMFASSSRFPRNKWVRIELSCTAHTSTAQLVVRLYYDGDSPYHVEQWTSAASFNTMPSGATISKARFGIVGLPVTNCVAYFDDIAITDTDFLGSANPAQAAPLLFNNSCETSTNGTPVTALNSGQIYQNTMFERVTDTAGAFAYSNAQTAHGTLSYSVTSPTTTPASVAWQSMTTTSAAMRFYAYFTGWPTDASEIGQFASIVSGVYTLTGRVAISSEGKIRIFDTDFVYEMPSTLSLNTWYRLELSVDVGTTAINGVLVVELYAGDSTTPLETYTNNTANLGTGIIHHALFGKINAFAWPNVYYLDEIAVQIESTTFIGPYGPLPPTPPVYDGVIPHKGWGQQL